MAEIPVEKKSSTTWVWLLLAAILAALLIWWLTAEDDYDDEAYMVSGSEIAQSETVNSDAEVNSDLAPATLATISADAQSYIGAEFSGEVSVSGPLTDRGFWVENEGARVFALIVDEPREVPIDINPGQQLSISKARIRAGGDVSDVEGVPLNQDTRNILAEQEVFLIVNEDDIKILERP